jgi:hypothetical protein
MEILYLPFDWGSIGGQALGWQFIKQTKKIECTEYTGTLDCYPGWLYEISKYKQQYSKK